MHRPLRTSLIAVTAALVGLPDSAGAQTIEESLRRLGTENAILYAHPVVSGVGAALNSGFYHTARAHSPLGFDFGIRAMGAFVPAADRAFVPILPASLEYRGITYADPYGSPPGVPLESPTALGEGTGIVLMPQGGYRQALLAAGENPDDFNIQFPEGFDFPAVPMAVAQLGLGVGFGTDAMVRFIPSVQLSQDVGSVSLFGVGLKHQIDRWFPGPSPVNLSASFGWQRLEVGSYLEARAKHASLIASRDVAFLTLYAGGTLEDTDVDIEYTVSNAAGIPGVPADGEVIAFTDDSDNSARFTVGSTFNLLLLRLNVDYSFSDYNVLNVNLLVSYR
ncbi:MAG: DUF6588 family protein [Gemmatimonadota bacterium]